MKKKVLLTATCVAMLLSFMLALSGCGILNGSDGANDTGNREITAGDGDTFAEQIEDFYYNVSGGVYTITGVKVENYTKVIVPAGVSHIEGDAFSNGHYMKSIIIPEGVLSIGECAFGNCWSLEELIIPDSIVYFEEGLSSSSSRIKYNEYDNALYLGNENNPFVVLVRAKSEDITSCKINADCKFILDDAFENCANLQFNVFDEAYYLGSDDNPYMVLVKAKRLDMVRCDINNNCKFICAKAFNSCNKMIAINIPDSVRGLGYRAFGLCMDVEEITFGKGLKGIGITAFGCPKLRNIELPDGLVYVGLWAFLNCSNVVSINIPATVTKLGQGVIDSSFLTSIMVEEANPVYGMTGDCLIEKSTQMLMLAGQSGVIPDGVVKIGQGVFSDRKIKFIKIPDSVKTIRTAAFNNCTELETIVIGKGVETIELRAFSSCHNLKKVYFVGDEERWNKIEINTADDGNYALGTATVYYYSESQPEGLGNFWHYDENGNVAEW